MTKELPKFKNRAEEVRFWETANIFEYTEPTDLKVELDPELKRTMKPITIRLRGEQISDLKAIAQNKDLPYQTMVRSWIAERIRLEQGVPPRTRGKTSATAKKREVG